VTDKNPDESTPQKLPTALSYLWPQIKLFPGDPAGISYLISTGRIRRYFTELTPTQILLYDQNLSTVVAEVTEEIDGPRPASTDKTKKVKVLRRRFKLALVY